MDAADPLLAVSSAAHLLCRTLGPAPAASPSKADEALLDAITGPLKGSKELVEQARMVLKEHGDIRMLYQDGGAKIAAAANGKNNQPGRRPALDRKRYQFTIKPPASKPVPVVDRSILKNITNPAEYFATLDRLDEAEKEIKRLKGEAAPEKQYNFGPRESKRRRNSVHTFKFRAGAYTPNPIEIPASQTETMTESQLSQDDAHASVSEKMEQPVPSRSSEGAISDVSAKEGSFTKKDSGDDLTHVLTSFQILDESEEEGFMRDTLGLPEIRMETFCRRDSIVPGDRPPSSTVQKDPMRVRTPKPGRHHARVLELEKRLSFIAAAKDKCADLSKDDELEGSPDIVMGEQSLVTEPSDVVLTTDETFAAREIDGEIPSQSAKSAGYDLDPEPTDHVTIDERSVGGSPLGLNRDAEVSTEEDPCSRRNISIEEDDVPMDYPTIDSANNETEFSSHHLAASSPEVLVSAPGRNVAPDDIARSSHEAEDKNQHQEVVEEVTIVRDKSSHPWEIPLDDDENHSQVDDGKIKVKQQLTATQKLAADRQNAPSLTKEKKQKAAQKRKKKQQPKRGKKVADEAIHPLEIPQENSDSENQPHMHDVNIEQQTVGMRNELSPDKAKGQKEAQRRNKTQKLNRRKSLSDAGLAWQSGVRRSTRIRSRPLEYWAGERFVYGRIHDTLTTVIGIKAYSPGQDGKKTLKVKSFVPEQYSDLVAESGKY